jgi:hypothetical protein
VITFWTASGDHQEILRAFARRALEELAAALRD